MLTTVAVLVGLAGCAGGAEPVENGPLGTPRDERSSSSGAAPTAPRAGASNGDTDDAALPDRRASLLAALREAGLPVSRSGDREVRAAEAACRLVDRGADAEDLGTRLAEQYPFIPAAKARELAQIVVSNYC